MKQLLCIAALCFTMVCSQAQTLRTPAPSPSQTIRQDFALSTVEVSYSRPSIKNRVIFGNIVPYGKVWRTGANNPTTITFSEEVMVAGQKVPAGKYGLLSIPGEKEWTVIISKQMINNPADYKQEQDLVRIKVKPVTLTAQMQNFSILFDDVKTSSMNLQMAWDKTMVQLPITADIDGRIVAQIDNLINKDNKPYFTAAMYYMENDKDLNKSLEWFNKALEQTPDAYWVWHQKANCLARLGKKQDAVSAANKSIELAKAAPNADYVELNNRLLKTLQ